MESMQGWRDSLMPHSLGFRITFPSIILYQCRSVGYAATASHDENRNHVGSCRSPCAGADRQSKHVAAHDRRAQASRQQSWIPECQFSNLSPSLRFDSSS